MTDLVSRIWGWLPGRTDSRRVTLPGTIAAALDVPVRDVSAALIEMERAGHVVRDSATGVRGGWHRGTPLPESARGQAVHTEAPLLSLFDTDEETT